MNWNYFNIINWPENGYEYYLFEHICNITYSKSLGSVSTFYKPYPLPGTLLPQISPHTVSYIHVFELMFSSQRALPDYTKVAHPSLSLCNSSFFFAHNSSLADVISCLLFWLFLVQITSKLWETDLFLFDPLPSRRVGREPNA